MPREHYLVQTRQAQPKLRSQSVITLFPFSSTYGIGIIGRFKPTKLGDVERTFPPPKLLQSPRMTGFLVFGGGRLEV